MSIKFSIHIPVYNVEEYVEECLESILNQNYDNYEIVIIDDGSTDNSGKICDIYATKDNRIKVYHQQNQGLLATRRVALKYADGDFVVFCDSDDKLKEGALSGIAKYVEEYACDMLIYRYEKFGNICFDGALLYEKVTDISSNHKSELMYQIASNNELNSMCLKAVRLSCVDIDESYDKYKNISNGEDLLQSLALFENCKKIVYVPDIFYCYRANEKSITGGFDSKRYKEMDFVRQEVLCFLKKNDFEFKKHLRVFSDCYIEMMTFCAVEVAVSDIQVKEKVKILKDIRELELFNESIKHATLKNLTVKRKVIFWMMKRKMFLSLRLLMKLI